MMIYTIGFTQKSAEQFFEVIKAKGIKMLVDVRLNNQSQLAGFTKGRDLPYFLRSICDCEYNHEILLTPTKELLDGYKKGTVTWERYEIIFKRIIAERRVVQYFVRKYGQCESVLLLCSECVPTNCHRRILAEEISVVSGAKVVHL